MEFWEAMKLLEEGKKVRKKGWSQNHYLVKGDISAIVNEFGSPEIIYTEGDWEVYDDRKEAIHCLVELYNTIDSAHYVNNFLDDEEYNKLREMLNKLNEKYRLD